MGEVAFRENGGSSELAIDATLFYECSKDILQDLVERLGLDDGGRQEESLCECLAARLGGMGDGHRKRRGIELSFQQLQEVFLGGIQRQLLPGQVEIREHVHL